MSELATNRRNTSVVVNNDRARPRGAQSTAHRDRPTPNASSPCPRPPRSARLSSRPRVLRVARADRVPPQCASRDDSSAIVSPSRHGVPRRRRGEGREGKGRENQGEDCRVVSGRVRGEARRGEAAPPRPPRRPQVSRLSCRGSPRLAARAQARHAVPGRRQDRRGRQGAPAFPYWHGPLPVQGRPTGYYGPLTTQAVKRWQAKYGLPDSGGGGAQPAPPTSTSSAPSCERCAIPTRRPPPSATPRRCARVSSIRKPASPSHHLSAAARAPRALRGSRPRRQTPASRASPRREERPSEPIVRADGAGVGIRRGGDAFGDIDNVQTGVGR